MSGFLLRFSALLLTVTFGGAVACNAADRVSTAAPAAVVDNPIAAAKGEQTLVLAGGCFWGIQAVFQHVKGVISATSGYSGGAAKTAEYEIVSTGDDWPRRVSESHLRSFADHLRPASAGVLLGGA